MIKTSRATERRAIEAYKNGLATRAAARLAGVSPATFHRILTRNAVKRDRTTGPRNKIPVDETYFDTIDNEQKAYWLGFIAADGCVRQNQAGGWEFFLRLSTRDGQHVRQLVRDLRSRHRVVTARRACTVRIVRKQFVACLMKSGITPNKARTLSFPQWLAADLVPHFVRGYFDGDGSCGLHRGNLVITFTSCSKKFLEAIELVLRIQCDLRPRKAKPVSRAKAFRLVYDGSRMAKRIHQFLYQGGTRLLARKKAVFDRKLAA